MEEKAPCPDYQVTKQRNGEDLVMSIATTAEDALDSQPHEHQIREGIHDLSGILGGIVVLCMLVYILFSFHICLARG